MLVVYKIFYTKTAQKDIPKLKSAHLDGKAKELIDVIRENPYQTPPGYEKLVGIYRAYIHAESINSTGWFTRCLSRKRPSKLFPSGRIMSGFETDALEVSEKDRPEYRKLLEQHRKSELRIVPKGC